MKLPELSKTEFNKIIYRASSPLIFNHDKNSNVKHNKHENNRLKDFKIEVHTE